jgi:hypothetical protein
MIAANYSEFWRHSSKGFRCGNFPRASTLVIAINPSRVFETSNLKRFFLISRLPVFSLPQLPPQPLPFFQQHKCSNLYNVKHQT